MPSEMKLLEKLTSYIDMDTLKPQSCIQWNRIWVFGDNFLIIFHISPLKHILSVLIRIASLEYSQHVCFFMET